MVPDSDDWIENVLENHDPTDYGPYSGMTYSNKEMIDAGVRKSAITEFARCIGAEMIFNISYLMDDPGAVEDSEHINWGLFVTDDDGNPIKELNGLHESVLDTDPTGREMCPKNNNT